MNPQKVARIHELAPPDKKICQRCEKPGEFTKRKSKPDGLDIYCRQCRSETRKKAYWEKKGVGPAPLAPTVTKDGEWARIDAHFNAPGNVSWRSYPSRAPYIFKLHAKYALSAAEIADVYGVTEKRIQEQLEECFELLRKRG